MIATARRTIPSPAPVPRLRPKALPRDVTSAQPRVRLRVAGGPVLSFGVGEAIELRGFAGLVAGTYVVARVTPGFGMTSTSLSIHLKAAPAKPAKPAPKKKPAAKSRARGKPRRAPARKR